jgi:carbonic anhydrase
MAKLRRTFVLAYAVGALSLSSCSPAETEADSHADDHAAHWGYEADNGPDAWGGMDPAWAACADGRGQSPINIAGATEIDLPAAELVVPSDMEIEVKNQAGVFGELDNGHTIQINARTGETLSVGDKTFDLVQFHFHAPSEHTIAGEHFPMEAHFVHQAKDGALAVVGVLLEEGAENLGIAPLWEQLAKSPGEDASVRLPVNFADYIFPEEVAVGVYHYVGSLTTPPCSEGVQWLVRKAPTQLSKDQIAAFTAVYDHNNRSIQPLNERTLFVDDAPTVIIR